MYGSVPRDATAIRVFLGWFSRCFFPPTAESFGVSAQIGSGVVWGGPEVRFHQGSTRVPRGSSRAAGYKEHRMLLGMSPELFFQGKTATLKRQ